MSGSVGVTGERRTRVVGDCHHGIPRFAGRRDLRAHRIGAGAEAEHHAARREREPVGLAGGAGEVQRCEAAAVAAMRSGRERTPGVVDGGGEQRLGYHSARGPASGGGGTPP